MIYGQMNTKMAHLNLCDHFLWTLTLDLGRRSSRLGGNLDGLETGCLALALAPALGGNLGDSLGGSLGCGLGGPGRLLHRFFLLGLGPCLALFRGIAGCTRRWKNYRR